MKRFHAAETAAIAFMILVMTATVLTGYFTATLAVPPHKGRVEKANDLHGRTKSASFSNHTTPFMPADKNGAPNSSNSSEQFFIANREHAIEFAAIIALQELYPSVKTYSSQGVRQLAVTQGAAITWESLTFGGLPEYAPESMPFSPSLSSFNLVRLGNNNGPTLLIIGGIQGDEPGAFSAAALLSTHYTISSGSVWVVPDLNFASILQRDRGLFGDMNRKFAALDKEDPEYAIVESLKNILLHDQVDLILNLHDGSGFYRTTYEGPLYNPNRWGQCVIIDQDELEDHPFGALYTMATQAVRDSNAALVSPKHSYNVRNTHTALGDKEMEKSLSWFAVRHGKPAFGIEASKEFGTDMRMYYHLLIIESFLRQMGITFTRDFELTPQKAMTALNSDLALAAYNNKLLLSLDDARPIVENLPFKKKGTLGVRSSKPLLALVTDAKGWRVAYGNRTLTRVRPAFMDFDDSLTRVPMFLDGSAYDVAVGDMVTVREVLRIPPP